MEEEIFQVISSYLFNPVSDMNVLSFVMALAPEKSIGKHASGICVLFSSYET